MNDVTQDSTIMKQITVAAECIATVVMRVPILNVHKRSSFLENQWFPFTMPRRMLLSVFHVYKYTLQLNLSCFLYFEMLLRLLGGWKQNSMLHASHIRHAIFGSKLLIDTNQNALWHFIHHRQSVRVIALHRKQLTGFLLRRIDKFVLVHAR